MVALRSPVNSDGTECVGTIPNAGITRMATQICKSVPHGYGLYSWYVVRRTPYTVHLYNSGDAHTRARVHRPTLSNGN